MSSAGDEFLGVPMYWSQYGAGENRKIVERAGFMILQSSMETATFQGNREAQLYVLAQKRSPKRTRRSPHD